MITTDLDQPRIDQFVLLIDRLSRDREREREIGSHFAIFPWKCTSVRSDISSVVAFCNDSNFEFEFEQDDESRPLFFFLPCTFRNLMRLYLGAAPLNYLNGWKWILDAYRLESRRPLIVLLLRRRRHENPIYHFSVFFVPRCARARHFPGIRNTRKRKFIASIGRNRGWRKDKFFLKPLLPTIPIVIRLLGFKSDATRCHRIDRNNNWTHRAKWRLSISLARERCASTQQCIEDKLLEKKFMFTVNLYRLAFQINQFRTSYDHFSFTTTRCKQLS